MAPDGFAHPVFRAGFGLSVPPPGAVPRSRVAVRASRFRAIRAAAGRFSLHRSPPRKPIVMTGPGSQPWKPSRDASAESFVFRSKSRPQSRFFVSHHEQVEAQSDERAIPKEAHVCENQALAHNDGDHGDVHWISNITVPSRDDEMTRRKNRRGRT